MRRLRHAVHLLGLCAALVASLLPSRALALTDPPITEAQAAAVCDQAGTVLWSYNADARMPMASITKVMTAMVALDSGYDLEQPCTITEVDLGADAQRAGYVATDAPTMRELLQATLIYSGNDAALNVGINVAGSEEAFVERMNAKAAELGMVNTHFANPHGLEEEGHYSSAADLVIMGRYAMEHYPFIAETVRSEGVELLIAGEYRWLESTDDLMRTYEGLLGIKTGAVESGYTFLGASQRGYATLYASVLGCETSEGRFADTATLMDWAYQSYRQRSFGRTGWVLRSSPYALGFGARCLVTLGQDQQATTWPEGGSISYRQVLASPDVMTSPGDAYGAVWWRQDGRLCGGSVAYVDQQLGQVPSVNVLALPLFMQGQAEEA